MARHHLILQDALFLSIVLRTAAVLATVESDTGIATSSFRDPALNSPENSLQTVLIHITHFIAVLLTREIKMKVKQIYMLCIIVPIVQ